MQRKHLTWSRKPSLIRELPYYLEASVNRTELVEQVATSTGLEKRQAEAAVKAVIDSVVTETKSGNKVSIFGFGTFTPLAKAARTGRNPRTGTAVKIPARTAVKFKAATAFNSALNTRGTKRASAAKKATPTKTAKAPAKKASAAKAPAKKAPAAKAPAKKVSAAKAPAKRATKATKATKK